jgi:hypothetical protein
LTPSDPVRRGGLPRGRLPAPLLALRSARAVAAWRADRPRARVRPGSTQATAEPSGTSVHGDRATFDPASGRLRIEGRVRRKRGLPMPQETAGTSES